MEIIAVFASLTLVWLVWQLIKAKRFTRFKQLIIDELKEKVIISIRRDLAETRCDELPNNDCHEEATILYWTQYKSRILHAALAREIIDQQWLETSGNMKNAQHLFFIERQHLPISNSKEEDKANH